MLKDEKLENYSPPIKVHEFLPSLKKSKKNGRAPKFKDNPKYVELKERFQKEFTIENSKHLFKKKARRKYSFKLTPFEYAAFVHHIKSLHRAYNAEQRRLNPPKPKKNRKEKRRRASYETYINSNQWHDRKNQYYQRYGRRCAACDTAHHIHLHHVFYGNFGHEPDEDLIPLCETHHNDYHAQNGVQRNMKVKTMAYVTLKRMEARLPPWTRTALLAA